MKTWTSSWKLLKLFLIFVTPLPKSPPQHSTKINVLMNQFQLFLHDSVFRQLRSQLFNLLIRSRVVMFLVMMFVFIARPFRLHQQLGNQISFRYFVLVQKLLILFKVSVRLFRSIMLVHRLVYWFEASVPFSQVGRKVKVLQILLVRSVTKDFEL